MKKNKGFTLIELLAVIVVLAVIALIATPIVLKLVNNAKEGAAESSATAYIKAVENGIMAKLIKEPNTSFKGTFTVSQDKTKIVNESGTEIDVDVKGNLPAKGGVVTIGDNGTVTSATFNISNYEIECTTDNCKVKGKKEQEKEPEQIVSGPTSEDADTTKTKGLIKIVYLDPTDLTKTCNATNSVSTTGTKAGCMKWYVYKDDGTNYTMILDHNTTATVAWNSEGSNTEMKEIKTELDSLVSTANWKVTPRLITADEIAQITGANEALSWDSSKPAPVGNDGEIYFYLDGASGNDTTWQTQIATTQGSSNYTWLYDYTNGCTSYGCNVEDSSNYGYWTSTKDFYQHHYVWFVSRNGFMDENYIDYTDFIGVRPVITISKSIIS